MTTETSLAASALILRSDFVFVSTLDGAEGFPETRVMFNLIKLRQEALSQPPASLPTPFDSWLGTNTSSQKVRQLRQDPRVCLYYADTATFEGLSLQGTVAEVLDPETRAALWMDGWETYYPGGRDGGDFSLFRFSPLRGRYYHGLQVTALEAGDLR